MRDISFDEIGYGNPSARDHAMMQKEVYLDKLIPQLRRFTPPKNSSPATKSELEQLMHNIKQKRAIKDTLYDEKLLDMLKQVFIEAGADIEFVNTVTDSIAEDVLPIITKLKYFFNRPRPSQLSYYYNMNFFSDFSFFTNNPSYPSTHTCLTVVTSHVLGNLYPEGFEKVKLIIKDVKESRLFMGVHYPSDNDMSMVIAKSVLENAEFKINYRL